MGIIVLWSSSFAVILWAMKSSCSSSSSLAVEQKFNSDRKINSHFQSITKKGSACPDTDRKHLPPATSTNQLQASEAAALRDFAY
eukprot:1527672-Pleurochrysis_carterae.AAC.1